MTLLTYVTHLFTTVAGQKSLLLILVSICNICILAKYTVQSRKIAEAKKNMKFQYSPWYWTLRHREMGFAACTYAFTWGLTDGIESIAPCVLAVLCSYLKIDLHVTKFHLEVREYWRLKEEQAAANFKASMEELNKQLTNYYEQSKDPDRSTFFPKNPSDN